MKRKREPRPAMLSNLPATFAEAEAQQILPVMETWPEQMAAAFKARGFGDGLDDPKVGHRILQMKFEHELANPRDADALATIVMLAEQGHPAAQRALRNYATLLLERGEGVLPASVRSYLVRQLNDLLPSHPDDRSEIVDHLGRDIAAAVMVDAATVRWGLPRLNSNPQRSSAAYYVGVIMGLGEQQVRRIYRRRAKLAQRLARFLIGDQAF